LLVRDVVCTISASINYCLRMREAFIPNESFGRNYPQKLTFTVFMICFGAALSGLMAGYVLGMAGGVTLMDSFLKEFYPEVYQNHNNINDQYCKFDSPILTWFVSSLYLAAMIGSLLASTFTRLFGRLETMFFGNLFFHLGMMLWCLHQEQLMVGCVFLGFGIGWTFQVIIKTDLRFFSHKYCLIMF